MYAALAFLRNHHKYYKNSSINEANLASLPLNDIPDSIWSTIAHSTNVEADIN